MIRHLNRRLPKQSGGFSWGRFPIITAGNVTGIEWRPFRRDHSGALQFQNRGFAACAPRDQIATVLCATRCKLREMVDDIDLQALMDQTA